MFWLCCWAQSAKDNVKDYLKEYINHAKQVSGQSQVDIIAHSMGGIVSRTYIQSDELPNVFNIELLQFITLEDQN